MHQKSENPGADGQRAGLDGVQRGCEHDHDKQVRHRTLAAEAHFLGNILLGWTWEDKPSQFRAATRRGRDLGLFTSSYAATCALIAEGGAH